MTLCSNPIQCQLANRIECTCDCRGANHGKLRTKLGDPNPEVVDQAKQELADLRVAQTKLKKEKSSVRRKRRAAVRANQELLTKTLVNEGIPGREV